MASRFYATAALLPLALAALVPMSGGCASKPSAAPEKVCTAGSYVFCRCQNRSEGTKLCNADGATFGACEPCPDDPPPSEATDAGSSIEEPLPEDAGFEPIDSATPPVVGDAGPGIEAKCVGKLVVIAGVDTDAYTGVLTGERAFSVSVSHGPGLRSPASLVALNGSIVAVYRSKFDLLVSTKFTTSWSAPLSIGLQGAASPTAPALTAAGAALKMVYLGTDAQYYVGTYSTGWDDAVTPIGSADAGAQVPGKSGPGVAAVGTSLVYGFSGSDGTLNRQMLSGTTWGQVLKISGAAADRVQPVMITMDGGAKDVMMAYVGSDQSLHSVTREASNKAWNTPVLVDDAAKPSDINGSSSDTFSLAPMTGGRAMLVYRSTNGHPYYSVFDPARTAPWSAPAEIVNGANPEVASTPMVVEGKCGEDAAVAYAVRDGQVAVMRYVGNGWQGPYVVGGMTKMKYVGIGELP